MPDETVGKVSQKLLQQEPDTRDPIELEREMHKDYKSNLLSCVERAVSHYPDRDLYIIVDTKKERLLTNVIRNYFFYRLSCPTPNYDQTVYKYYYLKQTIEFLWVIPSRDTCILLQENMLHIAPEEQELLRFVMDFNDGTLLKIAKRLNGEQDNSVLLEQ